MIEKLNIPVTYDWEKFKQYAEHCHVGSYQIADTSDNEHKEVRVHAGKFGFIGVYEKTEPSDQQQISEIIKFCQFEGFLQIDETVSEEDFYE